MNEPTCLITGVTLLEERDGTEYAADLFVLADCYIVNANEHSARPHERRAGEKIVSFDAVRSNYFSRRGVYVFPISELGLNPAARAYIKDNS